MDIDLSIFSRLRHFSAIKTPLNCRIMEGLSRLSQVESLTLSEVGMTQEWMRYIAGIWRLCNLTLDHADISDDAMDCIGSLTALEAVSLANTHVRISESSGTILRNFPNLRVLYLSNTPLDDKGLERLVECKGIHDLFLDGTKITDAGLASLTNLPNLEELFLANTAITDSGIQHICKLARLRALDVHGTRVTGLSLKSLATMPSLDKNRVDTANTRITAEEYEGWCRRMPK